MLLFVTMNKLILFKFFNFKLFNDKIIQFIVEI